MNIREIDNNSWKAGYQAGRYPTEHAIVHGCPKELDEYSWLAGFEEGQANGKKAGETE